MSSLSDATVVRLEKIEKHPEADTLEMTTIFGLPVIFKENQYKEGDLVVFVPVDLITSDEPEFDFWPNKRVKASKLRGVLSCGLVVKARPHFKEGDVVNEELRLTKYLPPCEISTKSIASKAPPGEVKYTDIESLRKYHKILAIDEPVIITEKIDGSNYRAVCIGEEKEFFVGSHKRWVQHDEQNIWSKVSNQEGIEEKIKQCPNKIFFGEVYGWVNYLRYGHDKGQLSLRFFDVFDIEKGRYLDYEQLEETLFELSLPIAPTLYKGLWFGIDAHKDLADGSSELGSEIKEGFVVRPATERFSKKIGRVILKYHSEAYLGK